MLAGIITPVAAESRSVSLATSMYIQSILQLTLII